MGNLIAVQSEALALASRVSKKNKQAKLSAIFASLLFVGGLFVFASDADLFARWGAVGIAMALIWSAYWSRIISDLQHEYAFGLRSSDSEFLMMMSGDNGALARDTVNALTGSIPKLATFILVVEILMSFVSTIEWGYGDKILCKFVKWEVSSC